MTNSPEFTPLPAPRALPLDYRQVQATLELVATLDRICAAMLVLAAAIREEADGVEEL